MAEEAANEPGNFSHSSDFLHALNAAAASLQRSSRSEDDVFAAFKEQIRGLGLNGSLALLGDNPSQFVLRAVVLSGSSLNILEQLTGIKAEGFTFSVAGVDLFQQVIATSEPVFVTNVRESVLQIIPGIVRGLARAILRAVGDSAGICTPLIIDSQVYGLLSVSGANLTAHEVPAFVAFANHLSIALENARLFQAMRAELAERREAEQALRRSEARFATLAANAPGVIYLCRNDFRFTMLYLNDAVERLTGFAKEEFLTDRVSFRELYHPDDSLLIVPEDEEALAVAGAFQFTYRIRHRSGAIKWVEDYGGGVFDDEGNLLFLAGILIDISARKAAEEALHESQRVLSTLMSNLPGMAYRGRNDPDWTMAFVSEGCAELTGYQPAELLRNRDVSFADLLLPEDRYLVWTEVQTAVARRQPYRLTYRLKTRSGEDKWVLEQGEGVFSPEGELLFREGFITDISEQKRAEEALRYAQKMESLGVLAGGIAHDFNNLLVAMLGQASLALAKLLPHDPAAGHIEKVAKAAERAADLTQQLLAYSGRGQFAITPIHLNDLIGENLHLLEITIPKNVTLTRSLAGSLPFIEADRGQIQQVIMNLIINAAEAIGEQPGTVTVTTAVQAMTTQEAAYGQYTNHLPSPGLYVVLRVIDDGVGMDDHTLSRIFDPFYTTKFTGRGLGLAAVLGIVRGHKGGLRIQSQLGQGTTFEVLFPASDSAGPAAAELPAIVPARSNQQECVLVIDDELPVREAIMDMLDLQGINVLTAANGRDGIELYRQQCDEISLVILDLSMPGMSGEQTLQELITVDPSIKVIVSSGYSEVEVSARFMTGQIVDYIQKPYDLVSFIERISTHLRHEQAL
jgi:PAS domain S-box-containing protein